MDIKSDNMDEKFQGFFQFIGSHILEFGLLTFTATRTFDIVSATSPTDMKWLPWAGIAIMEGAYIWWRRQQDHLKNDAQTWEARIAVGITWIALGITAAADAAWQASERGLLGSFEMPEWAKMVAVYSVVFAAMIHLLLIWLYRESDPDVELKRQHNSKQRKIAHESRMADLETERQIKAAEVRAKKRMAPRIGAVQGYENFATQFREQFGRDPEEVYPELAAFINADLERETKEVEIKESNGSKLLDNGNHHDGVGEVIANFLSPRRKK